MVEYKECIVYSMSFGTQLISLCYSYCPWCKHMENYCGGSYEAHLIFKYSWLLRLDENKKSSFCLCPMAFPTRALLSLLKLYLINVLVILNISMAAGAFVIIEVSGRVSHRWELLTGGIEVRAAGRVPFLPSARCTCVIDDNVCVDLHLQEPHRFITMSP